MPYNLITILGPTATGKTKLASQLALLYNGEIISADSRQVYKGMDIGTGKDLEDYVVSGKSIPYHLIDIVEPSIEFDMFNYIKEFFKVYEEIINRNKIPFLVGGSGLYLSAVVQNYQLKEKANDFVNEGKLQKFSDEQLVEILKKTRDSIHNTTDIEDKKRTIKALEIESSENYLDKPTTINSLNIGLSFSRDEIKARIQNRLKKRLDEGMIEEVRSLLDSGITYERMLSFGLEYKFIAMYLNNELSYNDMFQKLRSSINSLAKRQMTWFRKMEKEGIEIHWIEKNNFESAKKNIDKYWFND